LNTAKSVSFKNPQHLYKTAYPQDMDAQWSVSNVTDYGVGEESNPTIGNSVSITKSLQYVALGTH